MIAALALLIAAGAPTHVLHLHMGGDRVPGPCRLQIEGNPVDPVTEARLNQALAPYPPDEWRIELKLDAKTNGNCVTWLLDRLEAARYQLVKPPAD